MFRRIIIYITLICFIVCVQGCGSKYTIHPKELERKPEHKNVTIKTIEGEVYEFDSIYVYDDYIEGYIDDTVLVTIELGDMESVRVPMPGATKAIWYTLGIVFGIPLLLIITLAAYCALFDCPDISDY